MQRSGEIGVALQWHLMVLVLLAAVLHASWNAVVKSSGDRFLSFTAIRATGTLIAAGAAFFVPVPVVDAWPYLLAGVFVHNCYYVVLLQAYRFGDLSHVYPLARGIAPVTVAVLAALFAGEVPNAGGMTGILLVSVGIISLMFAGRQGEQTKSNNLKAVLLAIATGLFIASYTVVDGLGIRLGETVFGYIVWLNVGEGIPFMIAAVLMRPKELRPFLKVHWPRTTGTGLLVVAAYGLVLYALSQGAMAHISALRETSVLFAALIGVVMLHEPLGWRRIVAALIIAAGVILLQVS
ncbi:MAG: EamA family transporter [Rhodospirillales bacterium]|nr:EamA family transporter [Rhodospirillales bacterium]